MCACVRACVTLSQFRKDPVFLAAVAMSLRYRKCVSGFCTESEREKEREWLIVYVFVFQRKIVSVFVYHSESKWEREREAKCLSVCMWDKNKMEELTHTHALELSSACVFCPKLNTRIWEGERDEVREKDSETERRRWSLLCEWTDTQYTQAHTHTHTHKLQYSVLEKTCRRLEMECMCVCSLSICSFSLTYTLSPFTIYNIFKFLIF